MLKKFKKMAKDWTGNKKKQFSKIKNVRTLVMCESCYAFYYKNSWHFKMPMYFKAAHEEETPVFFTQCVACLEQEEALYETESNLVLG